MTPDLYREIEALRGQKTKALKVRYRELFGESRRHPITRTCSAESPGVCRRWPRAT